VWLGYRHLMTETWGSVQHYYSNRRVVFVVPVASVANRWGEASNPTGIYNLLQEVNLAIHVENNAKGTDFFGQYKIGRVAISGFSAGAHYMCGALSGSGGNFFDKNLKEVYSWDGIIKEKNKPNTVPQDFANFVRRWWKRGTDDKVFRVYTSDLTYDMELAYLNPYATRVEGAGGSFVKTYYKDNKEFATLAILPESFFNVNDYEKDPAGYLKSNPTDVYQGKAQASIRPEDAPGFPFYTASDPHHWFPTVFMYHALSHSGFAPI